MFESLLNTITGILAIPVLFVSSLFAPPIDAPIESLDLGSFQTVGGKTYTLSGSGISSTATSITLTSFDIPVSGTDLTMSNFGDIGYLTLEPGSSSRQEFVSFTGVTQNSDGTATLTGVTRGLQPISPYTSSSTYQKAHPGGSIVVISNPPQLYEQFATLANDESITGYWTAPTPLSDDDVAIKSYVDGLVNGGTVSNARLIVAGTGGATITTGEIVYYDTFQSEWLLADASVAASSTSAIVGVAQGAGTDGGAISGGVLLHGLDQTQIGMTAGNTLFVSDTAGATSTSAGTFQSTLGQARNATTFYFDPWYAQDYLTFANTWSGTNTFSDDLTVSGATTTFSGNYVDISATAFSFPKNQRVFTATSTLTIPSGIDTVYVEVIGGGGTGASSASGAGGGGGGAYCAGYVDVSATSTVAINIPGAGGPTDFSTFVIAGAGADASGTTGGAGGDCTLSGPSNFLEIENFDGGNGEDEGGTGFDWHGNGGGNVYGQGGKAGEEGYNSGPGDISTNGQTGTGYGTGGGGGPTGAVGRPGLVIVRW